MRFLIGVFIILAGVLGSYAMVGGRVAVLWQPSEIAAIFGAAIGSYLIANPKFIVLGAVKNLGKIFKGLPYNKKHYLEMLAFLFNILKVAKTKGLLAIESDIESPHESELFKAYPIILHNHHALDFFCDYMRMMSMGLTNHYQLDDLMIKDQEVSHEYSEAIVHSVGSLGEGMPALGIVAAVLGVIKTMGHVADPPEILGEMIGGALVGTFLGILASYGFVGPIAQFLGRVVHAEHAILGCIRAALVAHLQGNAPVISVEFARKAIQDDVRPSFKELDQKLNSQ